MVEACFSKGHSDGHNMLVIQIEGGGPRVVVSTAAFHEFGVRFPVSAVSKNVSSPSTCESQYCGEPP